MAIYQVFISLQPTIFVLQYVMIIRSDKMNKNYYITTAIAYTSAKPHIGNTYEAIFTDAVARFKRKQGYNVFFQTGTDEHGMKIEEYALKKGMEPKKYVDEVAGMIKGLWDKANVSYDKFIRTTDTYHEEQVQKIFEKFYKQGDIYKGHYEGWYCTPCESFWTDSQLVDGRCPDCGREVKKQKEECYFFKMDKYVDRLMEYYNSHAEFVIPPTRKTEMVNNFIKNGLQDLCVSRTTFKWGVPVGFDKKHVIYVWIDALANYITGLGYDADGKHDPKFKDFWPADLHVVGKDIVRFHIIYWPIMLMALGLPLPKQVYAHGWLLQNGEKMSKSKGNVLYFDDLADVFGVDAVRYYVLSEMGLADDGMVGWDIMTEKINSDLANIYGNLVSRTVAMTNKYFGGIVADGKEYADVDKSLKEVVVSACKKVEDKMNSLKVSDALSEIISVFRRANKYIDETEPWKLAKSEENTDRLKTVLYNLVETIIIGTSLLSSFMPNTAKRVFEILGVKERDMKELDKFGLLKQTKVAEKMEVLFPRFDLKEILVKAEDIKQKQLAEYNKQNKKEEKVDNLITIDDFDKVEIKVGEVVASERVENADKLLKNTVKIGDETRTIVSGIAKYYTPEEMVGKKVLVVVNLKPIKLRGIESAGMLLCAEKDGVLKLATVEGDMPSGSVIC